MNMHTPEYPIEEFRDRGKALYEQNIRKKVELNFRGKIVAIDIETGEYSIAKNSLAAYDSLYKRVPDAQIWCIRIGYRVVYSI